MDEEKIDLHPSEEDKINENVAELQSMANMEGDQTWYEGEVEDVHDTRLNSDGTYSYLIQWKNYPEKYWTHESNTSTEAIETWKHRKMLLSRKDYRNKSNAQYRLTQRQKRRNQCQQEHQRIR